MGGGEATEPLMVLVAVPGAEEGGAPAAAEAATAAAEAVAAAAAMLLLLLLPPAHGGVAGCDAMGVGGSDVSGVGGCVCSDVAGDSCDGYWDEYMSVWGAAWDPIAPLPGDAVAEYWDAKPWRAEGDLRGVGGDWKTAFGRYEAAAAAAEAAVDEAVWVGWAEQCLHAKYRANSAGSLPAAKILMSDEKD